MDNTILNPCSSVTQDYVLIPIAALNQYSYCSHRCWRMFCLGEFNDNQYTLDGTRLHERVHTVGDRNQGEVYQVRAIWLRSHQYQLTGKADLIEERDGHWVPIEYKRSRKGEFDNDEMQLCAQALCLEEMTGQSIEMGYLYYAQSHQRQPVELTPTLRQSTLETLEAVRDLILTGRRPLAVYGPRCKGCSLFSACLPRVNPQVDRYQEPD